MTWLAARDEARPEWGGALVVASDPAQGSIAVEVGSPPRIGPSLALAHRIARLLNGDEPE